jgi:hypothetical protein
VYIFQGSSLQQLAAESAWQSLLTEKAALTQFYCFCRTLLRLIVGATSIAIRRQDELNGKQH